MGDLVHDNAAAVGRADDYTGDPAVGTRVRLLPRELELAVGPANIRLLSIRFHLRDSRVGGNRVVLADGAPSRRQSDVAAQQLAGGPQQQDHGGTPPGRSHVAHACRALRHIVAAVSHDGHLHELFGQRRQFHDGAVVRPAAGTLAQRAEPRLVLPHERKLLARHRRHLEMSDAAEAQFAEGRYDGLLCIRYLIN